jgi:hypothetical protein
MMTPPRCARISGKTYLQAMIAPRRLMVAMRSNGLGDFVKRRVPASDTHADIVVEYVDASPTSPCGLDHRRERRSRW